MQTDDSGPVRESARITSLDLIRGVAVLGILLMNAVSFGLGTPPAFNLSAGGSETWLDWAVGVFGEVFIDQKFRHCSPCSSARAWSSSSTAPPRRASARRS